MNLLDHESLGCVLGIIRKLSTRKDAHKKHDKIMTKLDQWHRAKLVTMIRT